jgi:major membrane immunogen (membrane-anchored lipoprotein)
MTDTLLETTIADWRISDQCTEDLTPKQMLPWTVTIARGTYGGLMLEFCNVDGMKRLVSIEVDQGNVTVGAYRDADGDQDAKFHITDAAVFAQAGRNFPGSFDLVSFNEDETTISRDTIPAGLV